MFLFLCEYYIYIFVEFYRFTMSVFSVYTHLEGQVQKALERKCGFRHFDTNITVTTTAEMVSPERGCSGMAFRECPIHLVCQTRHRGSPWPGHLILLSRRRPWTLIYSDPCSVLSLASGCTSMVLHLGRAGWGVPCQSAWALDFSVYAWRIEAFMGRWKALR